MEPLTKAAAGESGNWKDAALDNDAGAGTAIPEYVVRAAMQVRDYLDESGMTRLAGLRRQNAPAASTDETPAETKRRMQDDGPEHGFTSYTVDGARTEVRYGEPEQPMCHQRPFNPGDRVQWSDNYRGRLVGTLVEMTSRRCWWIKPDDDERQFHVHEDGLTLIQHAQPATERGYQSWGSRREFQVRLDGQLWREAAIVQADTILRQGGLIHFAYGGWVKHTFIAGDVEVRQLTDAGA